MKHGNVLAESMTYFSMGLHVVIGNVLIKTAVFCIFWMSGCRLSRGEVGSGSVHGFSLLYIYGLTIVVINFFLPGRNNMAVEKPPNQ